VVFKSLVREEDILEIVRCQFAAKLERVSFCELTLFLVIWLENLGAENLGSRLQDCKASSQFSEIATMHAPPGSRSLSFSPSLPDSDTATSCYAGSGYRAATSLRLLPLRRLQDNSTRKGPSSIPALPAARVAASADRAKSPARCCARSMRARQPGSACARRRSGEVYRWITSISRKEITPMWTARFRIRPVSHCKEGCSI